MATTIITKYGSGAPAASDVVRGELAVDTENGRLYTEDSGGSVVEIGLNPSGNVDVTGTVTADGLTVDTDTLVVDATNNRVGIGTSSPSNNLEVVGNAGNTVARFYNSAAATSLLQFQDTGTTTRPRIGSVGNDLILDTANTERLRIDSSGNVGIMKTPEATNSNYRSLEVGLANLMGRTGGNDWYLNSNAYYSDAWKYTTSSAASQYVQSGGEHFWKNAASGTADAAITWSDQMKIDSSGNLLVGKDSTDFDTAGVRAVFNGQLQATASGNEPLDLNRLTSDGDLIRFYRGASSQVGSIGTTAGDIQIGSGDTALRFQASTDSVFPAQASGGGRGSAIDLGLSSVPFKDLYLSGGVVFPDAGSSGTSSSNKLDSYEEGSFTPEIGGNAADPTVTYDSARFGYYKKVGTMVFVTLRMRTDSVSGGSGLLEIKGLPFTAASYYPGNVSVGFTQSWSGEAPVGGYVAPSGQFAYLTYKTSVTGDLENYINITDLGTGSNSNDLIMSIVYASAS